VVDDVWVSDLVFFDDVGIVYAFEYFVELEVFVSELCYCVLVVMVVVVIVNVCV